MDEPVEISCGCGDDSPWDRESATLNQALMGLPVLIGSLAMAKYGRRKLLYYIPGVALFLTCWRRFTCARCRYYGRECSTMLGIMTARMMPPDEGKPLDRNAMYADFAFIGLLSILPLPQVFKRLSLGVLYLAAVAAGFSAILFNACGRCGNDFCPMKDLHRVVAGGGR